MFSFLLVVLIHVTKTRAKNKKNPKQTQKTSAQTVIYDKKGLLRKVWAVSLTLGRVFRERMICRHPVGGLSLTGGRKQACGWLTGSWDPSFKKPVVLCYLLEKSWHLWLLKGWICVTCAACFFMLLRRCLPGKWCSLGQRRNSIASWYTCFTVIGLDVLSMRGTVWHTELTC